MGTGVPVMDTAFDIFADATPDLGWPDRPRYLVSYVYVDDDQMTLAEEAGMDVIIDSGAFTVANSGGEINHDEYLDWLVGHAHRITFALSLDVIGDAKASRANHEYGVGRVGDKVHMVPAWHLGSSLTDLAELCRDYTLVAIGGAVPFAKYPRQLATAAGEAHRVAATHGTKLHGLGMTGTRILHTLPWYSVDSSTWGTGVRFPTMRLTNDQGQIVPFEHGQPLDRVTRQLVTQYGGDPTIVGSKGWALRTECPTAEVHAARRRWIMTAGARAYMHVEAYKNAHQPAHPIKVHLAGKELAETKVVVDAHQLGNPWTTEPSTTEGAAFA